MDEAAKRIRKRRTPVERRGEIVGAAITLFARQGFERTTTKEIAAEAGISEGTIYKYFASKQEILFAFIEPVAFQSVPLFFQAHAHSDDAQVIRAFIRDRLNIFEKNRDLIRVILGEALFNPVLAAGLHRAIAPAVQALTGYITRRQQEGQFRDADPAIAARALVGSVMMNFVVWNLLAPQDTPQVPGDVLCDELATIFLHGVACPTTAEEER